MAFRPAKVRGKVRRAQGFVLCITSNDYLFCSRERRNNSYCFLSNKLLNFNPIVFVVLVYSLIYPSVPIYSTSCAKYLFGFTLHSVVINTVFTSIPLGNTSADE